MNTKGLDYTILTIAIIGAINWGLVGFFKIDLVNMIFGNMTIISRVIYAVIGLCGLYLVSLYGRVTNALNGQQKKAPLAPLFLNYFNPHSHQGE